MLALVYVFFLLLYVAFSVVVVIAVGRWAAKRGKVRWKWAAGAAAVMWLIVFWDWIPTVLLHRHLCNTWAGVTIYKTPEQWLAANQGKVKEPLKDVKQLFPEPNTFKQDSAGDRLAFGSVLVWHAPFAVLATTRLIVDRASGVSLIELRAASAGSPPPGIFSEIRRNFIWLQREECAPGQEAYFQSSNGYVDAERMLK